MANVKSKHFIEIRAYEESYAEDSSDAYQKAEDLAAESDSYPCVYPEPFKTVGCGYGQLSAFVIKEATDLANQRGLDWEVNDSVEIQLSLFGGSIAAYVEFERQLKDKLAVVEQWLAYKPSLPTV